MQEAAPLVSVIVPVYNVERYLDQALESIERQTLRNMEIICVNDGSTDGSLAIMERHASRDERIRIVNKPNGGYGSACNRGMEEARGTWIAIVEPDDWIDAAMYEDMIVFANSFETQLDIVKTPYWRVIDPDTPEQHLFNCSYKGRIRPVHQPFSLADSGTEHLLIHHPSIWSALYHSRFLSEKNIRFKEIPGAGWADNPFLVETLCQASAIAYLDRAYYYYREDLPGSSSVLRKARLSFDRWNQMLDIIERLGITDDGILKAFYVIGFRYVGGGFADFGDDNPDIKDWAAEIFRRMDPERVVRIANLSGYSKKQFFELSGFDPLPYSNLAYYGELIKEFIYSTSTNGIGFGFKRIGLYARQVATQKGLLKQKLNVAED